MTDHSQFSWRNPALHSQPRRALEMQFLCGDSVRGLLLDYFTMKKWASLFWIEREWLWGILVRELVALNRSDFGIWDKNRIHERTLWHFSGKVGSLKVDAKIDYEHGKVLATCHSIQDIFGIGKHRDKSRFLWQIKIKLFFEYPGLSAITRIKKTSGRVNSSWDCLKKWFSPISSLQYE